MLERSPIPVDYVYEELPDLGAFCTIAILVLADLYLDFDLYHGFVGSMHIYIPFMLPAASLLQQALYVELYEAL